MWVKHLPPDYQRRFYTNLAIVIALVLFVTNVWRLGRANGTKAVLALIALLFAYGMLYRVFAYFVQSRDQTGSRLCWWA